jgi:hypothetical protein
MNATTLPPLTSLDPGLDLSQIRMISASAGRGCRPPLRDRFQAHLEACEEGPGAADRLFVAARAGSSSTGCGSRRRSVPSSGVSGSEEGWADVDDAREVFEEIGARNWTHRVDVLLRA